MHPALVVECGTRYVKNLTITDTTICDNNYDQLNTGYFTYTDGGGNYIADECLPDLDNGACCVAAFPVATCDQRVRRIIRDALGGTLYVGVTCDSNPCPAVGTCCLDGESTVTFESDCAGQWYEGVDTPDYCTTGACCLQDLTCVDTIAQECTGVFTPNQTCGEIDCQPYAGYGGLPVWAPAASTTSLQQTAKATGTKARSAATSTA